MKILIAITCLAIIAGVGLLFYRDHQTFGAADKISAARVQAEAERRKFDMAIFEKCKAAFAGDIGKDTVQVRDWCRENGKINYEDQHKAMSLE